MPHREAAWALLAERLDEAAWLCDQLRAGHGRRIAGRLDPVLAALREISRTLAAQLPAGSAHARLDRPGTPAGRRPSSARCWTGGRAGQARSPARRRRGPGRELAELFGAAHAIVTQAAAGLGCTGRGAGADRAPAGRQRAAAAGGRAARRAGASSGGGTGQAAEAGQPRPPGRPPAGRVWEAARAATALRARLGRAGACPPELAEATAALQDLAGRLAAPGEAAARLDELWELQAGLPAADPGRTERAVPGDERAPADRLPGGPKPGPRRSWRSAAAATPRSSRCATAATPGAGSATPRTPSGFPTGATPTTASS